jgi:CRISPR-associated protein Csb1
VPDRLTKAVHEDAAIRKVTRLQPAGGKGDKIFPPTYPGNGQNARPVHVKEDRRIAGAVVPCVLIDSVQSQANRFEEALLAAAGEGRFTLPRIVVDFSKTQVGDIGEITSLEAPHRVFDAILRDSDLDGVRFREKGGEAPNRGHHAQCHSPVRNVARRSRLRRLELNRPRRRARRKVSPLSRLRDHWRRGSPRQADRQPD